MRTYEALYILSPELGEDDIQTIATDLENLVTQHEGSVVRSEIWGKRKLAYDVNKHSEGVYVLLRFDANTEFLPRLETHFKLSDHVIRHMLVHFDEQMLRLEAEQVKRNAEERAQAAQGRDDDDDDDDDDGVGAGSHRRRRHHDDDDD